ncbi:MAG: tandem-95 repeat protein, partial [Verrucomicrobiota bacterium]
GIGNAGVVLPDDYQGDATIWGEVTYNESEIFSLNSNEGAAATIYLDFNGHVTSGTWWNSYNDGEDFETLAFSTDSDRDSFSDNDLRAIHDIWQRVSEDFAPFNVNVTTQDPGVDGLQRTSASDPGFGVRVVIGPKTGMPDLFQSAGGIAFLNTFDSSADIPAFSFNGDGWQNPGRVAAMTISHEVGHTLGLSHDGLNSSSYHPGTSAGGVSWGPLMGAPFSSTITQWSNGDYSGATETEDDLSQITTYNGFTYKADDYGDSIGVATSLNAAGDTGFTHTFGTIERNTDSDFFQFYAGAGSANIQIEGLASDSNLDILAEILDEDGNVLFTSDLQYNMNASFNVDLPESGSYFLRVTGTGQDGLYSDYGSLGVYQISGTTQAFAVNSDPNAVNDAYDLIEDSAGVVFDVLANDVDPNGDPITLVSHTDPLNGGLQSLGNGRFSYVPGANFAGVDSFSYTISDGRGGLATGQVSFSILAVNDNPVASDINAIGNEDSDVVILIEDFISDVDGDTVRLSGIEGAQNGTVFFDPEAGSITYRPDSNFFGVDAFTYTVADGNGGEASARVNLQINSVNDLPSLTNDSATLNEGETVSIDVLANDTDIDGDTLTISTFSQGLGGSVSLVDGQLVYTANEGFIGNDSFTYSVSDGNGGVEGALVSIQVEGDTQVQGPKLNTGTIDASSDWQTVTLDTSYDSMVVVATPVGGSGYPPLVARIQQADDDSFQIKVQRVDGLDDPISGVQVQFIVVEAGIYTEEDHGIKLEAVRIESDLTDYKGSWQGESQELGNDYENLVVLGQVMTTNDEDHSVFWSRGQGARHAADGDNFYVGKHVGEDPDTDREAETIGYIVLEAGLHTLGGIDFVAGVTEDNVTHKTKRVDLGNLSADGAVLSSAGMDGRDGGITTLANRFSENSDNLYVTITEDTLGDSERRHTTEQVSYLAFGTVEEVLASHQPNLQVGEITVGSEWQTVTLDSTYESMVVVATPIVAEGDPPVTVRIHNAVDGSFDIQIARLDGDDAEIGDIRVQFIVVEEGVYTEEAHGVEMEARKVDSDLTFGKGNWNGGDRQDLKNSYDQLAVLGQVMTSNDEDFSLFYSRGKNFNHAPNEDYFYIGKHAGEDPDSDRESETLGFIAIESGVWNIGGVQFAAGVTGDNVTHSTTQLELGGFDADAAVVSQTGVDGRDGGFAVRRASDDGIAIGIDEDTLNDSERRHTTEQVAYFAFVLPSSEEEGLTSDSSEEEEDLTFAAASSPTDEVNSGNYLQYLYEEERKRFSGGFRHR